MKPLIFFVMIDVLANLPRVSWTLWIHALRLWNIATQHKLDKLYLCILDFWVLNRWW